MAFDSNLPANNSPIVSAELRNQFNALKALIDGQAAQITQMQTQLNDTPSTYSVIELIAERAAQSCGSVDDLQLTVSNPPTQAEVQAIVDKLHELMFQLKDE